ncbi:adenosylcobinamide-GDP ribazoletransferase, partial [Oharaeibacter diazotrophicus]
LAAAGPGRVALGLCATGLAVAAVGRIARAKIGGQTGDVLGAAELLGETAFLTGLLAGGNG